MSCVPIEIISLHVYEKKLRCSNFTHTQFHEVKFIVRRICDVISGSINQTWLNKLPIFQSLSQDKLEFGFNEDYKIDNLLGQNNTFVKNLLLYQQLILLFCY